MFIVCWRKWRYKKLAGGWENGLYRQGGKWCIDLDVNSCTFEGKTFSYLSHNTHMGCSCFSLFCQTFCCIYNTSFESTECAKEFKRSPTFFGEIGSFLWSQRFIYLSLGQFIYTPENWHRTQRKPIEKEHHHSSSSKPSCLGSMSIFRGVYHYSDGNHLSLPSILPGMPCNSRGPWHDN